MTTLGTLNSHYNPDVMADDHSLHELNRDRTFSQYENIRHNSIRGKETFKSKILSDGPEAEGNFNGQHFFAKARAIDTLDDYFTPDPCTENPSFSVYRRKILMSCQQSMVSALGVHHNQRPPRFGDSVKMSYYGDGPNASTARLRNPRYQHKEKLDQFSYACAAYGVEEVRSSFRTDSKLLGDVSGQAQPISISDIGRWNSDHESPNIPGPFPEVYGCSKEYKYVGNHPDFKDKLIYNGQFPNELLAIPKNGKGSGSGQYKGKTIVAREAVEHYDLMCQKFFKDTGKHLVASGYRPLYHQQRVREKALKKYGSQKGSKAYRKTATPGSSNHGIGLAVDFTNGSIDSSVHGFKDSTFHWLVKNAHNFGYYHPKWAGPEKDREPWHWEYALGNKIFKLNEDKNEYSKRRRAHQKSTKMNCDKKNPKIKV